MGPNLIALAIPFFFALIGVELLVSRVTQRRVYRLADTLTDLGCGVGQQIGGLLYRAALLGGHVWLYQHARLFTLPVWGQWALGLVGVDFVYYWWHRLSHEVRFLWAAHVVHHQSEDYNLAVALRQSVTTSATSFPFYAVLTVLGVPPLVLVASISLSTLYQFWIHTELVPRLPRFEWLFNSPAAHRVHHAVNPRYLDKNHGATLTVWDRLFGTWEPETEPCVYGITRPLGSFNPVWAQLAGWVELWRHARQAPSLRQALQLWVRSPGWKPDWLGHHRSANLQSREKYDVRYGPARSAYAVFWLGALSLGTFAVLQWGEQLTVVQLTALVAVCFATLLAIGGVLEHKRWVTVLEPLRYAALAGLAVLLIRA